MKLLSSLCVTIHLIFAVNLCAQDMETQATLLNINNFSYWVHENGLSGVHPQADTLRVETGLEVIEKRKGGSFPFGAAGVINHDGLVWGGDVEDGEFPTFRVGGHTFRSGLVAGRILSKGVAENPEDPDVRIWRIRRDWQTADLTRDTAEIFNTSIDGVTEEQIAAVRAQYETDWNQWPWQKGAPFYDNNENGIMDAGEEPGLANADQVVWFVANDLSQETTIRLYGSPPIGMEVQVTLWAYQEREFQGNKIFGNTIFKRHRLIYKGTRTTTDTAQIEDMFIAQWSNPDIGDADDDFVGCDTALQVGFGYNGSSVDSHYQGLDLPPAAIGYTLIQGPIIATGKSNDTARFNFTTRRGFKNLPLWAFMPFDRNNFSYLEPGPFNSYEATIEWELVFRGCFPLTAIGICELPSDNQGNATRFPFNGDPVTGSGFLDGYYAPAGDRRFMFSTGPFTMALGDTQEVIIALVGGVGADNRYSVQVMKHHAKWARQLYHNNFELQPEPKPEAPPLPSHFRLSHNFPNPFNPSTEIRFELPVKRHVTLTVYNTLGQQVKTLVDEVREAGSHAVTWDGTDEHGQPMPSGVYFYRFDAGVVSGTKKMILMR